MYLMHSYATGRYGIGRIDIKDNMGKNADAEKWMSVDGTLFDRYDMDSFLFGWIYALQNDPGSDDYASSNCFLATFDLI